MGEFHIIFYAAIPSRVFGVMSNEILVAVPLFVFMGVMLERSKVAEDLLKTMGQCFGRLPGGLGISVTLVGMLLAASTGIVGATVVTMGLLSLPTMLRAGYDHKLACGTICASGTLGQIIPLRSPWSSWATHWPAPIPKHRWPREISWPTPSASSTCSSARCFRV